MPKMLLKELGEQLVAEQSLLVCSTYAYMVCCLYGVG